jgi:hypothetical protein
MNVDTYQDDFLIHHCKSATALFILNLTSLQPTLCLLLSLPFPSRNPPPSFSSWLQRVSLSTRLARALSSTLPRPVAARVFPTTSFTFLRWWVLLHSLKATRQFGARCAPYPYAKEQRHNKHLTIILNRFPPPCSESMCCYLLAYINIWLKMKYNQWSSFSHTIQGSSIFCWLRAQSNCKHMKKIRGW